ncbi:hypothetical protein [Acidovorax sp.]|uniref:hypothetical protein n=1 Tax=Acidovorax sp. TaxID=1872122 RepID=UPI003D078256
MGTLGTQPPRPSHRIEEGQLDYFLADAVKLANKHKISVDSVIEAQRVLELGRANDLRIAAGDYHDEHMGGFGDILSRIADALDSRE